MSALHEAAPLTENSPAAAAHPVVLFDGVCNLCNGAVDFLITRDRRRRLRFGSLQSPIGAELAGRCAGGMDPLSSMVLIENGRCHFRSAAVILSVAELGGAWRLVRILLAVPPVLRDAVYRLVARHRYRWFGVRAACRVPTHEERAQFLE